MTARFSLRARILLLVASIVVGGTFLVLATVFAVTRYSEQTVVQESVRAAGASAELVLRERARTLTIGAAAMAEQPTIVAQILSSGASGAAAARADWATVSGIAQDTADSVGGDMVVITDADGNTLGEYQRDATPSGSATAPTPAPAARPDYRTEPGLTEVLKGERNGTWRGVVVHNGELALASRVALREPVSHYVRGTLSAYARIDTALAHQVAAAVGFDVAFLHENRVYSASRALPRDFGAGRRPSDTGSDTAVRITLPDAQYVTMHQPLHLGGAVEDLRILVLYPYDRAATLPRQIESALIAPFLFSLLIALCGGVLVARGVTQPLEGVVAAARVLQAGEWPERFRSARTDEIGLLQNVFDEMTVSLQSARERLLRLIDTDPLTSLDNHRRFQERLAQETERAVSSAEALSLLLIDIDHFHDFNQRAGHAAGDAALCQIADLLRSTLPPLAIAARFGGEEFAVILPRHAGIDAALLAERVREGVLTTIAGLTVSIGYAEHTRGTAEPESLMLASELAVAQAKQMGRNRVCEFDALAVSDVVRGSNGLDPGSGPLQLHRFLKDGSLATIQALAAAVDAKDPYTRGHSQRVAERAVLLARRLGLPAAQVDLIYTTGTLHDVGKIGVPDRVLQKNGFLDDEERQLIETHVIMGEVIVGKVPQLSETLAGVRGHHERWDGRGYPDGLAGTDIPLAARILALADTFDAMTSDRPYRAGLPVAYALEEIARNAGTQFDPDLAPVFIEAIREEHAVSSPAKVAFRA